MRFIADADEGNKDARIQTDTDTHTIAYAHVHLSQN